MVIDAGLEGIVDAFGIKAKKNKFSKIDKIRMYVCSISNSSCKREG